MGAPQVVKVGWRRVEPDVHQEARDALAPPPQPLLRAVRVERCPWRPSAVVDDRRPAVGS